MAECYEARRNDDDELSEKERANRNNAQNLRNAADVAIASGEAHAVAIGEGVKVADKLTGGKSTDLLGKGMTNANKIMPGGKRAQALSNKIAESGIGDKAGKAASMYNSMQGSGGPDTPNQVKTTTNNNAPDVNAKPNDANVGKKEAGGGQNGSLPSSSSSDKNKSEDNKDKPKSNTGSGGSSREDSVEEDEEEKSAGASVMKKLALAGVMPMMLFGGFFIIIFIVVAALGGLVVSGFFSDFEDAFGVSETIGEENGNVKFVASSKDQQDFYDRINEVKLSYQSNGKTVDAIKVVAVYHILDKNGADVSYKKMSKSDIEEIADAMFSGNTYNEETFKSNLTNNIFPKYLPDASSSKISDMVDDVFDYVNNYNSLIGKEESSNCSSSGSGSCDYDIKGFYVTGKGNVVENLQVSDLYVRLMQCGDGYGGTWGQPLDGEDLVPFEKYVLGVAYLEVGEDYPAETIKAQMVAARSYALARHVDMGGWRTLQQEDGKWILKVAACTADQVYCDPDQGCSGSNNQWAQIHSGLNHGTGFSRQPLSSDSPMRTYASETEGEVLVNSQGYIIYTTFYDAIQRKWKGMAESGLNYKQILLQHYNQGEYSFGASDIQKANCGGSATGICKKATGDWANWKQYEGSWINVPMGTTGSTIRSVGCLATSIAIQVARSGVPTNVTGEFNPGTFVEAMSNNGAFSSGGALNSYAAVEQVAPTFKYQDYVEVAGWSRQDKLSKIKELTSQNGVYVVAEVKGNTGQHWVAIDSVEGDTVKMFDPGSASTDMWSEYSWSNTSRLVYWKVG